MYYILDPLDEFIDELIEDEEFDLAAFLVSSSRFPASSSSDEDEDDHEHVRVFN